MATSQTTKSCARVPLIVALALWGGATALLIEDAANHGAGVQNLLMPVILTAGTVAAAVYAHKVKGWGLKSLLFVIAVLGSTVTIYGTMGRVADNNEARVQPNLAKTLAFEEKNAELALAKKERTVECKKIGQQCEKREAKVTKLANELATLAPVSLNPKVDAAVDVLHLVSGYRIDKDWLKRLISTIDPILLPIFLELGSIVFFAAAFQVQQVQVLTVSEESVPETYTRTRALEDLQTLRTAGFQKFLADRWGQSEATVSKWAQAWEGDGLIERHRVGKSKAIVAMHRKG